MACPGFDRAPRTARGRDRRRRAVGHVLEHADAALVENWLTPSTASDRTAAGRSQSQHGSIETQPAHGARLDELVVAARHECRRGAQGAESEPIRSSRMSAGARSSGSGISGRRPARLWVDDVARAVDGENGPESCRRRRLPTRPATRPVSVTSPIRPDAAPAVDDGLDLGEALGRDDRDHPLLRLGDHDLPGLHPPHAAGPGRDGRRCRSRRPSLRATTRARPRRSPGAKHEPTLDELDRDLDQPLAGERVADLDGRPLVGGLVAELLAREHRRAPIPSRPVVAPKRTRSAPAVSARALITEWLGEDRHTSR